MARMNAGKAVVEALRAEGVECIFGVAGWTRCVPIFGRQLR